MSDLLRERVNSISYPFGCGSGSAAEALRHPQDVAQLPSHSSLKLADKEYLLDGFKFLIKSSDPDEQIRLLTLAPPEWGRVKVEEYFECSRYLAQKSISVRVS